MIRRLEWGFKIVGTGGGKTGRDGCPPLVESVEQQVQRYKSGPTRIDNHRMTQRDRIEPGYLSGGIKGYWIGWQVIDP